MSDRPCISCGRAGLAPVLSLGNQPLANALLTADQLTQPEATYPLELAFCGTCALVQITEVVPPEALFREYLYFSSYSETMLTHASSLVTEIVACKKLGPSSLVVEIASNDGYLLQYYKQRGVPILGIEPALNVARAARARGIPTVEEFFGKRLAVRLVEEGRAADLIHAHNVLAHVSDPNDFLAGIHALLTPRGTAVVEVPYVKDMIDRCEFDTIYHEHLCYFSLTALEVFFARHGLVVEDVQRVAIHGGSLRLFLGRAPGASAGPSVDALRAEETAWGAATLAFYEGFARRVDQLMGALRQTLADLKREGRRIAGYGAAAKGATLLNSTGIDVGILDFVADRSPHKQGWFMPGSHVPIVEPGRLLEDAPDVVLVLAWNLAEEILAQQAEYHRRGGRFLIPVPEIRFV